MSTVADNGSRRERARPAASRDLNGMVFGKWTVLSRAHYDRYAYWNCRCLCGKERAVLAHSLEVGVSTSCGCTKKRIKHGQHRTRLYSIWSAMRWRCNSPKYRKYSDYGGRGIKVCERWNDFANFYSDVGERPSAAHSLDRINNDGDYEPNNVQWATRHQQSRNKRNSRLIVFRGQTKTITDFCAEFAISVGTVRARLNRGWPIDQALTTPPDRLPSLGVPL